MVGHVFAPDPADFCDNFNPMRLGGDVKYSKPPPLKLSLQDERGVVYITPELSIRFATLLPSSLTV